MRKGVIALAVIVSASCGDPGRQAAQQIRTLTVPPGDSASEMGAPDRKSQSVEWAWEVDTHLEWNAYVEVLSTRLSQFHLTQRTPDRAVFSRFQAGDQFVLTLATVEGLPATRVRVTLVAMPG